MLVSRQRLQLVLVRCSPAMAPIVWPETTSSSPEAASSDNAPVLPILMQGQIEILIGVANLVVSVARLCGLGRWYAGCCRRSSRGF